MKEVYGGHSYSHSPDPSNDIGLLLDDVPVLYPLATHFIGGFSFQFLDAFQSKLLTSVPFTLKHFSTHPLDSLPLFVYLWVKCV